MAWYWILLIALGYIAIAAVVAGAIERFDFIETDEEVLNIVIGVFWPLFLIVAPFWLLFVWIYELIKDD